MKKLITIKSIILLGIVIVLTILSHSFVFAVVDISTTTGINNNSPVFTATVSDGGSDVSAPTNVGGNVTFTATAKDINSNQYYLAVCKTQYVKPGSDTAPSCCTDSGLLTCTASEKWAISTATDSGSAITPVTYTVQSGDPASNAWYAFVCDKNTNGLCYPANDSGDQGLALGTVTFTGIPADAATLIIDGVTYEFDTGNNGVTQGNTEVDTSAADVETNVASLLAAAEIGASSHMLNRSNITYVYADTKGTAGNSIGMAETGDTGNVIALSGTNLSGGSDANASPFYVNQIGTFGTVTVTDSSDLTIEPGDTLKFKLPEAQIDDDNNMNMYICTEATTAFDYGTNACTGGSLVCSDLDVDPATEDAVCTGGADLVSVPTAHGSYNFKVYVEDVLDIPSTGTNTQSYSVTDVPPTLSSYTATDAPAPTAGGSDTVDFSAAIVDNNGDNDVTAVEGVFFDDTAVDLVAGVCTADEKNCYIVTSCTLADVSAPGTGKTATGTDANLTANCSVTVWFNADASTDWEVHVNPTDGLGKATTLADSNVNITNPDLSGIDIVQASIAYGTLVLGHVSDGKETSMGNMGNLIIDIMVEGNTMCTDYPTCSGNTIALAQQKWHHTDSDFNWNSSETNPGPYTIVDTASGTDDETGCLNRDIAVRTVHDNTGTNESIYWKLKVPNNQAIGTYTGENTFATTASTTCTAGQLY